MAIERRRVALRMSCGRRLARRSARMAVPIVLLLIPIGAQGQVTTLSGRVTDADNQQGIRNAVVSLEGYGFRLTEPTGEFQFDGVAAGDHVLTVEAFGYSTVALRVRLPAETPVTVALEPAALSLDSLLIESRTLDFDGRIRDPRLDYSVKDARVTTDQGHEEWSNAHGRFDLDDVREGVILRVSIRAFGYLPVDTAFVPDDDGHHDFDLVPDPLVAEMIEVQHRRLANRAGEFLYEYRPALTRDVLSQHMGTGTLETIVESRYPPAVYRSIGCVLVDDEPIRHRWDRDWVIRNTIPEDLERIELLEVPGPGRSFALRVYTRQYFQVLIAGTTPEDLDDVLDRDLIENPCGEPEAPIL
jgi:hypothetical protein